jgi:hypothetical protein
VVESRDWSTRLEYVYQIASNLVDGTWVAVPEIDITKHSLRHHKDLCRALYQQVLFGIHTLIEYPEIIVYSIAFFPLKSLRNGELSCSDLQFYK